LTGERSTSARADVPLQERLGGDGSAVVPAGQAWIVVTARNTRSGGFVFS
jgi:hypothetical protein